VDGTVRFDEQGSTPAPPGPGKSADATAPDWDAYITLQDAAAISGLSYGHLRKQAANGDLRTVKMGARLNVTTRRWLDAYLRTRGTTYHGRPPKSLPEGYQAPPKRGRPPKSSSHQQG
jgi:hypothetical protein